MVAVAPEYVIGAWVGPVAWTRAVYWCCCSWESGSRAASMDVREMR